jgi:2-polyprenyl-3-methyl-5-hydroxy-6-metoxy-1,4-benzoquinol methylase
MVDLRQRLTGVDEIMDDFALPAHELNPVLKGLGNLNAWFGGHKAIIKALQHFKLQPGCRISDWGCGGGDALKAIAVWAQHKQLPVHLTGVDAAPAAIEFARQETSNYTNIDYRLADVLNGNWAENEFDIVFSSLFTHHFDDEQWVALVKHMYRSARQGVIITDLHRHRALYYALKVIFRIVMPNPMMQNDGPLSVQRSFTRTELVRLLAQAGITRYKIEWKWAFRWQVVIYKG